MARKPKTRKSPQKKRYQLESTKRGEILFRARDLTVGDRNRAYGNPYDNFLVTAELKRVFWHAVAKSKATKSSFPENIYNQDTPFGHAIDMVLTNLGRIAASPMSKPQLDRFIDGAAYIAIAGELADREVAGGLE